MTEPLRITYLQAENVKRLKAIRLAPDKTLVRIEGRNGQGKTSVLDAISATLGGGKYQPDEPVRKGEKRASATLRIGDLKVERRWTAGGGTVLEITEADGCKLGSPQAVLDRLVSDLTFDPLLFFNQTSRQQTDTLKRLAGLDFDAMDAERDRLFTERTVCSRDLKNQQASLGSMPSNVPAKTIDVAEIAAKNQVAQQNNQAMDRLASEIGGYKQGAAGISRQYDTECKRLGEQIEQLEKQLANTRNQLSETKSMGAKEIAYSVSKANESKTKLATMERIDTTNLAAEIQNAETTNRMIRDAESWKVRVKQADAKQKEADALTDKIEKIDADKTRRLQDAKFPVAGLTLEPTGPMLHGIPLSQASAAERLRVGVAMGLAEKKPLRLVLIRDGSLLDSANLQALHEIAIEFDAQIFIERVADQASPSAVFIEDGEIVEGGAE